jgi:hypothetical protein
MKQELLSDLQVVEYITVSAPMSAHLDTKVRAKLAEGWQPYGNAFVAAGVEVDQNNKVPGLFQTMVKLA